MSIGFNSHDQRTVIQAVFFVVGLVCITGFATNLLALAFYADPMALDWRIAFMQQVSGRSIVLFLGLALVLYSCCHQPAISRLIAMVCLIIGIVYLISGVLIIRDGLALQNQAIGNIDSQSEQISTQLQSAATNPNLPPEVTPQQIEEAKFQLESQTEALKQNARSSATKSMVAVLSTQIVIGLGLLSLGRFGIKKSV